MPVKLEGQCSVIGMEEGATSVSGTLCIRRQIGRSIGAEAISLRILEFAAGLSPGIRTEGGDDVLYFLERLDGAAREPAQAKIFIDGWSYDVGPQTGVYLRDGQTLTLNNPGPGPVIFVSSQ